MTYSKEPELTLAEHTAYERGRSHALAKWKEEEEGRLHNHQPISYNQRQWYLFGYKKGLKERKKQELKDLVLSSP